MSLRRKLLLVFSLTVAVSVAGVAWLVQEVTGNAFEKTENQRTAELVTQFQREFSRQGEEVVRRVQGIAASDAVSRISTASSASLDSPEYFDVARTMAENHQLDFVELLDSRGNILSSAQWSAKFGYTEPAFQTLSAATGETAFLKLEEMRDSIALGLFAVRATREGEHAVYVVGGWRLDRNFLAALNLAPEMRLMLYQNRGVGVSPDLLIDPTQPSVAESLHSAEKLSPLIDAVRRYNQEVSGIVNWSSVEGDEEAFHAIPLRGVAKDRPL